MFDDFFTTYNMLDPPEFFKKDIQQFNDIQQPMITAVESEIPEISNYSFNEYSGLSSPFDNFLIDSSNDIKIESRQTTNQNNKGLEVVNIARQFLNKPYVWASTDPNKGFDCSGLIQYVYKQIGINLPRTSHAMGKFGTKVELSEVQPGDVIYTSSKGPSGGHVKMVSSVQNGQIYVIEAKSKDQGIIESPLTNTSNIISIRRMLSTSNKETSNSISNEMARQIKIMESGSENPTSKTAKVGTSLGETFATGLFGMVYEYDKPNSPKIKEGQTFSLERWNSIFNAFHRKSVQLWKNALRGKSNVTQDKLDALSSISMSGNWATPNGWFGKFVIANWDNPQAIHDRWLNAGVTASSTGKVLPGLIKRRKLEADWFIGIKNSFK